jgi:DnaJ family protein C protein 9
MNAYEYYRSCHPEISKDDVTTYTNKYKGSKDEEEDLIVFYNKYHGNITKILEHIIASETSDISRFIKFFIQCFEDGRLVKTDKFIKTSIKIKLLDDEEEAANQEIEKINTAKANR